MRDDERTNEQVKIELLSQWKLEAESRNSSCAYGVVHNWSCVSAQNEFSGLCTTGYCAGAKHEFSVLCACTTRSSKVVLVHDHHKHHRRRRLRQVMKK